MTPEERAKLVLDHCAHELRSLSLGILMTLQDAIAGQIKDAVYEALRPFQKKETDLKPWKQGEL